MLKNMIVFPIMLLFFMGVKECQSLKCFDCHWDGKEKKGDEACRDLKSSDTTSPFLKTCPSDSKSCIKTISIEEKSWSRGCEDFDLEKCTTVGSDSECFCKKDACNGGPPGNSASYTRSTPSSMLAALCMSWVLLRTIHHLF